MRHGNTIPLYLAALDRKFLRWRTGDNIYNPQTVSTLTQTKESLYGVHKKIQYLDNMGANISNALIVLDNDLLAITNNDRGHLLRKHPALSGESPVMFQAIFVRAFFDVKFFTTYLHYLVSGRFHEYMVQDRLLDNFDIHYDDYSNEMKFSQIEAAITANPAPFYEKNRSAFYERSKVPLFAPPVIDMARRAMLLEVCELLIRHRCQYKIIVSPLYNQKKVNPDDLLCLQSVFGAGNVFDFSGINNITQSYTNYYESSHYRPHVAREILKKVYK